MVVLFQDFDRRKESISEDVGHFDEFTIDVVEKTLQNWRLIVANTSYEKIMPEIKNSRHKFYFLSGSGEKQIATVNREFCYL